VALYIDERVPHVGNDNRQSIATMGGRFLRDRGTLPNWDGPRDVSIAQSFGQAWIEDRILPPSRPIDREGRAGHQRRRRRSHHPDAARIAVGPEKPVALDRWLLGP